MPAHIETNPFRKRALELTAEIARNRDNPNITAKSLGTHLDGILRRYKSAVEYMTEVLTEAVTEYRKNESRQIDWTL